MAINIWTAAMESGDAKTEKKLETEVVVYSKISEPARLEECNSKEDHVQLETNFSNGTRCRVRKTTKDGKTEYVFTFKVPAKQTNGTDFVANMEHSAVVDEAFFEGFKSIAQRMLVKTRYNFTSENVSLKLKSAENDGTIVIPNIEYEVDVYTKVDGTVSEWCKIDVEIDNVINYIEANHKQVEQMNLNIKVSHLPFGPKESILSFNTSDENRIKIDEIWKEFTQDISQQKEG